MAEIDIDRHIVTDMVLLLNKTEPLVKSLEKDLWELNGLLSQYKALLLHIVNRINKVDTGKGKEYIRLNGSPSVEGKGNTQTSLDTLDTK